MHTLVGKYIPDDNCGCVNLSLYPRVTSELVKRSGFLVNYGGIESICKYSSAASNVPDEKMSSLNCFVFCLLGLSMVMLLPKG